MDTRTDYKRVNYYLPAELVRRVAIVAAEQGTNRSQLVRRALEAKYPELVTPAPKRPRRTPAPAA